ncbi:MAG: class I SAM-dependent methyltransferase [Thermoanaerobaculia bacterium]|nr:class I SAM-dependent methyltransferase [Thermoanaerobaculia bacterium]
MIDESYFERETFQLHPAKGHYFDYVLRLLRAESIVPPAHLLDIGAGVGLFSEAAEGAGYRVTGVEASSHAAALARARVRGPILCHDANSRLDLPERSFDAVTMLDVIEHLRDFTTTLGDASRLLRTDGKLILITLNAHSVLRPLLGRDWSWYRDPTHVHLFSARTLRAAVLGAGFGKVRITTIFNFHSAGESSPPFRPLRRLGRVLRFPWVGDSLLVVATR